MKHRGFTLIELMCVVGIAATLIGTTVMVFGFCACQTTNALSTTTLWTQLNNTADRIELTVREANSCTAQSSGSALQCAMPNSGQDLNQDGQWDTYNPRGIDGSGLASYTVGAYVWYYTSSATNGAYGSNGSNATTLWRAIPSTSASPVSTDVDSSFSKYYSGNLQYGLVNGLSVTVNAAARSVTFTVTANSALGELSQNSTGDSNFTRTISITRTVTWRNWN